MGGFSSQNIYDHVLLFLKKFSKILVMTELFSRLEVQQCSGTFLICTKRVKT